MLRIVWQSSNGFLCQINMEVLNINHNITSLLTRRKREGEKRFQRRERRDEEEGEKSPKFMGEV